MFEYTHNLAVRPSRPLLRTSKPTAWVQLEQPGWWTKPATSPYCTTTGEHPDGHSATSHFNGQVPQHSIRGDSGTFSPTTEYAEGVNTTRDVKMDRELTWPFGVLALLRLGEEP